jgi:hypothetical protein
MTPACPLARPLAWPRFLAGLGRGFGWQEGKKIKDKKTESRKAIGSPAYLAHCF